MVEKKRDIFIKIEKISDIVSVLENIRDKDKYLKRLFNEYDKLNLMENKIFENWSSNMDEIIQKLEHVTL